MASEMKILGIREGGERHTPELNTPEMRLTHLWNHPRHPAETIRMYKFQNTL